MVGDERDCVSLAQGGLGTNYKDCFKLKNLSYSNFSWLCSCPFGFAHCKGFACWGKSYRKSSCCTSNEIMKVSCVFCSWMLCSVNKDWTHQSPFCCLEIKMPFSDIQHFSWNESQSLRLLPPPQIQVRPGNKFESCLGWNVSKKKQTPRYHTGLLSCINQDKRL